MTMKMLSSCIMGNIGFSILEVWPALVTICQHISACACYSFINLCLTTTLWKWNWIQLCIVGKQHPSIPQSNFSLNAAILTALHLVFFTGEYTTDWKHVICRHYATGSQDTALPADRWWFHNDKQFSNVCNLSQAWWTWTWCPCLQ